MNQPSQQSPDSAMTGAQDAAVETSGEMMEKTGDSMMDSTGGTEMKDTSMEESAMAKDENPDAAMASAGSYTDYSAAALETAAQKGKAVLFFHASWCPTCKAANEAFTTRTSEIPADVTILKTDYDAEKDLKARYGITYQHTFVQVDAEGNEITKWNGGDIEELQANLK